MSETVEPRSPRQDSDGEDMLSAIERLGMLSPTDALAFLRAEGELGVRLMEFAEAVTRAASGDVASAARAGATLVRLADESALPLPRARCRRAAARALANLGRFEPALERCVEGIAIADTGGMSVESARLQLASMHPLAELGRVDEAATAGALAMESFRALGERTLMGRAAMNLGVVDARRDRPTDALRHFDAAADALAEEPLVAGQIDSNRGEVLVAIGDVRAARAAFERALDAFEALGAEWQCAVARGNLGDLAQRAGRPDEALAQFEHARRLFERTDSVAHMWRIVAEQAEAKATLGLVDEAVRDHERAIAALATLGVPLELARARSEYGRTLLVAGRLAEAATALAAAATGYAELGHETAGLRADLLRAELLGALGRHGEAVALAEATARTIAARGHPIDGVAANRLLAQLALDGGDVPAALVHADAGVEAATRLDLVPLLADLARLRGLARRRTGDVDLAIADFRTAVASIERLRSLLGTQRFRSALLGSRLAAYEDLVRALVERGDPRSVEEAFDVVELARNRALLDTLAGAVDRVEPADVPDDSGDGPADTPGDRPEDETTLWARRSALRAEINLLYGRLDDERSEGERLHRVFDPEAIRRREIDLDEVESRLAATAPRRLPGVQPIDARSVADAIPAGTLLVEYVLVGDELLAFTSVDGQLRLHRWLADRRTIVDAIASLHFQMSRGLVIDRTARDGHSRMVDDALRVLGELHDHLIGAIEELVDAADCLIVVPHGPLHLVPFHALHDGRTHLVERLGVAQAPSASTLCRLLAEPRRPPARDRGLVVGCADEMAPRIDDESVAVASLLGPRTQVLTGAAATTRHVIAAMRDADPVHLACHGRFDGAIPRSSGLRLADGWLTVRDLPGLRIAGDLVILSGCETGRSLIAAGDDLVGLVQGFLAAGAGSLVVSLWRVDDARTCEFMRRFHEARRRAVDAGALAATMTALRDTQIDALRRDPHPAHWAPFVLIGRP